MLSTKIVKSEGSSERMKSRIRCDMVNAFVTTMLARRLIQRTRRRELFRHRQFLGSRYRRGCAKGGCIVMCYRWQLVATLLLAVSTVPTASGQASKSYDEISSLLSSGSISRICVIHVPTRIETRTRIDARALRRLSQIELCSHLERGSFLDDLEHSLTELKTSTPSRDREVRWGILFLDAQGKERAAIFLDPTGQFAEIAESQSHVEGKILACIRRMIKDELS